MTEAAQTTETASTGPFTPEIIAEVFGPDAVQTAETEAKPAPVEAPAEAEPKEKPVSDRIAAAMRAEKKAAEDRAANERRKKELEEREGKLSPRESDLELFEKDPAAFVAKKNWTPAQVADFLDKLAGNVQPEALTEKKLSAQEQRIADLEAKLAAKEKAEEERVQTTQQRQIEAEAGKGFIDHIVSTVDKYPHLTEVYANDAEVVAAGFAVLTEVIGRSADGKPVTRVQAFEAKHGRGPTDQELAEHLDAVAKAKIEARSTASWRKGTAANQAGQAASGESKEVPPVNGTSPRTLSRADTSTRAAAPRPSGGELSQEEKDAQSIAILEKAMRKG